MAPGGHLAPSPGSEGDILRGIGLRLWTSCRSHFNKSWQCPKNISIIKGATTKQKGQVNIEGTGIASSAFGTFTQTVAAAAATAEAEAESASNLCRQQAIKQPRYIRPTTAQQNDLNTHNLGGDGEGAGRSSYAT